MSDMVSILVPVYNVKDYLSRCVDSLLAQTYEKIEIILVDDCSTDGSADVAKDYANRFPTKCKYVQREKNGGLSAARNSGIQAAQGRWLTFVDSDDWVDADYVDTLVQAAVNEQADVVMSSIYYYYSENNMQAVSPFDDLTTASSHGEKIALSRSYACTRLFERALFEESGILFPEDIRRAEDMATIIPIMTRAKKIAIVPKAMYYYFQRSTSISNSNQKGVDLSFYPKTIGRMIELSAPGYETELQYRAVSELMYGMVMIMLRSGRKQKDLSAHVDWFNQTYPNWQENKYLSRMAGAKRLFVRLAAKKQYLALKLLILAWDVKQKLH